jgi:hypothetical protein
VRACILGKQPGSEGLTTISAFSFRLKSPLLQDGRAFGGSSIFAVLAGIFTGRQIVASGTKQQLIWLLTMGRKVREICRKDFEK